MGRLGTDLEEKQEPRVASLAEAQKPKRQRVTHEVTRARLDTGRDREADPPQGLTGMVGWSARFGYEGYVQGKNRATGGMHVILIWPFNVPSDHHTRASGHNGDVGVVFGGLQNHMLSHRGTPQSV